MSAETSLTVCGEKLLLHGDRAVIWARCRAVIVADTHFGKSSVFNQHGVAVPAGTDELDRARLTRLLDRFEGRRLIILGDFVHGPLALDSPEARDLERWTRSLAGIKIQVIAGNHDRGVSRGWRGSIEWIAGDHFEAPFRFVHDCTSKLSADRGAFSLSGHLHPVIALKSLRKRSARVPAFWLRKSGLILPSFGSFTGGFLIAPKEGERVFAVSPEKVVPFPIR